MSFLNFWKKLISGEQPKKRRDKKTTRVNSSKRLKKKTKRAAARKKIIKKPKKKTPRKIPRLPRKHKRTKTHKKHRYKIKIKKLSKKPKEKEIGIITHYFDKISVGIIKLKADLKLGETIRIKGLNSDFIQTVKSMQLNHKDIAKAKKGDEIGIKVIQPVGKNNKVYRVTA